MAEHTYGDTVDVDGAVMLLWRNNGAVRLPKGHVEPDETLAACALREVGEETRLRTVEIVTGLGTIENHIACNGMRFIRQEAWFLMTADDPTVHEYSCDSADPERHWVPGWYPLERRPRPDLQVRARGAALGAPRPAALPGCPPAAGTMSRWEAYQARAGPRSCCHPCHGMKSRMHRRQQPGGTSRTTR